MYINDKSSIRAVFSKECLTGFCCQQLWKKGCVECPMTFKRKTFGWNRNFRNWFFQCEYRMSVSCKQACCFHSTFISQKGSLIFISTKQRTRLKCVLQVLKKKNNFTFVYSIVPNVRLFVFVFKCVCTLISASCIPLLHFNWGSDIRAELSRCDCFNIIKSRDIMSLVFSEWRCW